MAIIKMKTPPNEEQAALLVNEAPRYKAIVEYVAQFVYMRSTMGDMDTQQVLEEFNENVTELVKEGLLHGVDTSKMN